MGRRAVEPRCSKLAFVSTSRDHKQARLREADAATGAVREINEESVATQYESGDGKVNWQVLYGIERNLWYSERSGWGHFISATGRPGRLKARSRRATGLVRQVVRVDEKQRVIWFLGAGREKGAILTSRICIGSDSTARASQLLTPEDANHEVTFSPSGDYFVDSYSKPDVPPVAVVRDATGKLISDARKGGYFEAAGLGLETAGSVTA